jgi:indolepyruvate ferredoxin oxidoreductase
MMSVFRVMAKFRFLRGTALDVFGYSADRKLERDLIAGYEKDVATVLGLLSQANHDTAVEILSLPGPHSRLRPGEGQSGEGRQGALRAARCRSRQSADGATPDGGGVEGFLLMVRSLRSRRLEP